MLKSGGTKTYRVMWTGDGNRPTAYWMILGQSTGTRNGAERTDMFIDITLFGEAY